MKTTLVVILMAVAANFYFAGTDNNETISGDDLDTLKSIEPKAYYILEEQLINTILSRYHYNKFDLNDSLSSVILDRYLKSLDYSKSYFLLSDIQTFDKYRYQLDDDIKSGNISPFYDMFNVFMFRMKDRIVYLDTLLTKDFDYSIDEEFLINRENVDWTESQTELNNIWRQRVKNDALNLKLSGKDWEAIKINLSKRYENY